MNTTVLLAELSGATPQPSSSPKNIKVEKPQNGPAVTVHLEGDTRLDLGDVASEKLTFVRAGDKLIVLFDNQSTVSIDPVFDPADHPLADIAFELAPDRILSGDEFASLFPISTGPSVLSAAGTGNGPTAGAHFGDRAVDGCPAIVHNAAGFARRRTGASAAANATASHLARTPLQRLVAPAAPSPSTTRMEPAIPPWMGRP